MIFEEYQKTYQYFLSLTNLSQMRPVTSRSELKRNLHKVQAFLDILGNPEKKLTFIHIGGTSGKGSITRFVHEGLCRAGKKVGSYNSPHTTTYLERFQVNNTLLPAEKLTQAMKELIIAYEKFLQKDLGTLNFFELSTCLALYSFAKEKLEWCVLEVGCGGRYDATNVIPPPKISAISNIDKDHTHILGHSLAEIAFEKAGIIKKGSTVFCGEQRRSLKPIFTKEAIQKDAALFFLKHTQDTIVNQDFGAHQQANAKIAQAILQEIGISDDIIQASFQNHQPLPCRFEIIQSKPEIVLDGAHSPVKIQSTVDRIQDLFGKAHIIFGSLANKDNEKMLNALSKVALSFTTTRPQTTFRKASNPRALLRLVPKSKQLGYFLNHQDALDQVKKKCKKNEAIVITGSLYLAGEMRKAWIPEKQIVDSANSFPLK